MDAIGGQEIKMPVVHAADVWKESGRYEEYDESLTRFHDRHGRDMVLATTHEEIVADLASREVRSYRQLPCMVYHFQTKWRDEARPTSGLLRVREFTMKDSYSLDAGPEGLEAQYRAHYQAYFNIFRRCGLPVLAVRSDVGMMGGSAAHEFMYLNEVGENTLALCDACGYAANTEVARFARPEAAPEEPAPLEKVATPGAATIAELAAFLDIPESRTAKAVFLVGRFKAAEAGGEAGERLVPRRDPRGPGGQRGQARQRRRRPVAEAGPRRGDRRRRRRPRLRLAHGPGGERPRGRRRLGGLVAEPGLRRQRGPGTTCATSTTAATGRPPSSTTSPWPRRATPAPTAAPPCASPGGVEVGNIFQLGTRYSEALGASFLDEQGRERPVIMGSYGIGVGRLLACVAEEHHDEDGLSLPVTVAPYQVHLVSLARAEGPALSAAEALYEELTSAGVEVLYDDRGENPGVKFNDADLIGCPVRVTVGDRGLKKGTLEVKLRGAAGRGEEVPVAEVAARVQEELAGLRQRIEESVGPVEYAD